ncbi:hypothetical protein [Mucilaginibacter dorajii]|uniref:Uncharacterized protein n=1 Tax=Mucilaginibacter dorajii TaxID=692994 RepID=A0ABP7QHH5_9SPHI|nr:hypothetical protein [Mucilaginibacter dorajii]MCS3736115.1 hypothetical protein [Mucilaginibacter dorajii]
MEPLSQIKGVVKLLALLCTLPFIYGCTKQKVIEPESPANSIYFSTTSSSIDSGIFASYWLNDKSYRLQTSTSVLGEYRNTLSVAYAITVYGKDVYIAGALNDSMGYWKNKKFHCIAVNNRAAYGIVTNGTDVYTLSDDANYTPVCYKNDKLYGEGGVAIAMGGNDVYVVSRTFLFKNNVPTNFSTHFSYIEAVAVSGNNVYVGGRGNELLGAPARVLKNGAVVFETDNFLFVKGLAVKGNDLYVAGNSQLRGTISVWKNNEKTILATPDGAPAELNCIAVDDNGDVYAGGQIDNIAANVSESAYWKNGVLTILSTDNSIVTGIGIVKK